MYAYHNTRLQAFSLIELMVVIAIIALLAAIAVPAYVAYVPVTDVPFTSLASLEFWVLSITIMDVNGTIEPYCFYYYANGVSTDTPFPNICINGQDLTAYQDLEDQVAAWNAECS